MYFVRETSFESCSLKTPLNKIDERISELYMRLINRYMNFGLDFMKSFYTAGNRSLSAYMSEVKGQFEPDTVMARSEREITAAQAQDICTIVKGCVLEWCLMEGNMNINSTLQRIINLYLQSYLN